MFSGMIAPENPPLRIAKRTLSWVSWRVLKFGPSTRSRSRTLFVVPCAPTTSSVWQPEQRSENSCAPCWMFSGWDLISDEIPCDPHATAPAATARSPPAMARRRRPMTAGIIRKAMKGGRATVVLLVLAAALATGCGDDVRYAHAPDHRVSV